MLLGLYFEVQYIREWCTMRGVITNLQTLKGHIPSRFCLLRKGKHHFVQIRGTMTLLWDSLEIIFGDESSIIPTMALIVSLAS
jgi:hypothetical protein